MNNSHLHLKITRKIVILAVSCPLIALINFHNFTFIGILSVSREPDPPEL